MYNKILVITVAGIGNAILFTPTLRLLKKYFPHAEIDCFARREDVAKIFEDNPAINKVFCYNAQKTLFSKMRLFFDLRKKGYDISITAFPSNSIEFNILAYFFGAKLRLTHEYDYARLRTLSFLQNRKIKANSNLHDVENNANLLKLIGVDSQKDELKEVFILSDKERNNASKFIIMNKLSKKKIIGIHPGCKARDSDKRWPRQKFVELINRLLKEGNIIFLFAGPDEIGFVQDLYEKTGRKCYLITNKTLKESAAFIEKCDVLLTTDSGLGHVSTALDVNTIAIIGPANYVRIRPYGKTGHVIRNEKLSCSPCFKYPFRATSLGTQRNKIRCDRNRECLRDISVEEVYKKINFVLKGKK